MSYWIKFILAKADHIDTSAFSVLLKNNYKKDSEILK